MRKEITIFICDGCGAETTNPFADYWLIIAVGRALNDETMPSETRHACCRVCLRAMADSLALIPQEALYSLDASFRDKWRQNS